MKRNILLVEPDYKTKFPPLGLMKISSYHKLLGDQVKFVKGITTEVEYEFWDRIYVATLFTFEWTVTTKTILHYKKLVKGDLSRLVVGGIMASLMSDELWRQTGVKPIEKVMNSPGILDSGNNNIIDRMIPDYSLFDGIKHSYSLLDSYFGYSTRGCVNKCGFCGVPKLEPEFIDYQGISSYVKGITESFGVKKDLVLFDNNILASKRFPEIISDIRDLGFTVKPEARLKGKARYVDFNQGIDARLLTEEHMKLFSTIPINPLRLAFDQIGLEDAYRKSVMLAAKNNVTKLSNYILYNYTDSPEDLWKRLKITIDLNKEYNLRIYSFPMKYIPITAKDRKYVSPKWNWQFIRNVQRVLNVLKGSVMTSEDFFFRAFGENTEEFLMILHMPEKILMYRSRQPQQIEMEWIDKYKKLTAGERNELRDVLCEGKTILKLRQLIAKSKNQRLRGILDYYSPDNFGYETQPLFDLEREDMTNEKN